MSSIRRKLTILADAAKYDASCASSGSKRAGKRGALGSSEGSGICHSYTPDGRCISLLKILLTNFCIYDCKFCVNRASSDTPRARFEVSEVVRLTMEFYRRNYIEGLFLSSGIIGSPDETMQQIVEVARRLREEERFGGYIHLKVVPGASEELIDAAGRHADRLSVNVELPTQQDLSALAPEKDRRVIELGMDQIGTRVAAHRRERKKGSRTVPQFAPAGQSTQMVIGATETSDRTILASASSLYSDHGLRRVYYSGYSPHEHVDSHLPARRAPLLREHRLYQADWLMRFYGFDASELTSEDAPDFDLSIDPKLAWALRHPERFPIDVNRASRRELLRVPGFGRTTVSRILSQRRNHRVRYEHLAKMGPALNRARPFIAAPGFKACSRDWLLLDEQLRRARLAAAETASHGPEALGERRSGRSNASQMSLFS